MLTYLVIGGLGLISGFLSGLVGIGGGIVMAPLLLYAPPVFGLPPLPMKVVAGLTIVQGLVGCVTAALFHRQFNFVSSRLALYMGTSIFLAAAAGGAASDYVSNRTLLAVFATLALVAVILMFVPPQSDPEEPDAGAFSFSAFRAVSAATGVGLLGGLVGQGGSFILIPLMTSWVRVPTRLAIGTNLAIVLLSSAAAFIGKAVTGQIEWWLTLPILITVIPAARIGSWVSGRTSVRILRSILAFLIGGAALRIWFSVFAG